jgi:hypothetical protein
MNAWNSEFVYKSYPAQSLGFLVSSSKTETTLQPQEIAMAFRKLVAEENCSPTDTLTLTKARSIAAAAGPPRSSLSRPIFGYVCKWLSELGKTEELSDILKYADKYLGQSWERGGLYYARNDTPQDQGGNWTHMDTYSGNAAVGYSRLNV